MRVLHHWPLDPFSRCVRLALVEKGLEFRLAESSPWSDASEAKVLNPLGGAPVLVDENDAGRLVIAEPRAILEYLNDVYDARDLLPGGVVGRAEARWVMGWLERGFDAEVNASLLRERLMQRVLRAGTPNSGQLRKGSHALRGYMRHIEAIAGVRPYLAGDDFSLADICVAAHLSCHDYFGDVLWRDFPLAQEWYVRMKSRPSFRPLLKDVLPGAAPVAHYAELDF